MSETLFIANKQAQKCRNKYFSLALIYNNCRYGEKVEFLLIKISIAVIIEIFSNNFSILKYIFVKQLKYLLKMYKGNPKVDFEIK